MFLGEIVDCEPSENCAYTGTCLHDLIQTKELRYPSTIHIALKCTNRMIFIDHAHCVE